MTRDQLKELLPLEVTHIYNGIATREEIESKGLTLWWGANDEGSYYVGALQAVTGWKSFLVQP